MPYRAVDPAPLRRLGLRATGPRVAVLAALREVGGHRSANDVIAVLRKAGYAHARTTVSVAALVTAWGAGREPPVDA